MGEQDTPDPASVVPLVRESARLYRNNSAHFELGHWTDQWAEFSDQLALVPVEAKKRATYLGSVVGIGIMLAETRTDVADELSRGYQLLSDPETAQFLTHLTIGRVAFAHYKTPPSEIDQGEFRVEFAETYGELLAAKEREGLSQGEALDTLTLEDTILLVLNGDINTKHIGEEIDQANISPTMREISDIEGQIHHFQLNVTHRKLLLRMLHLRSRSPWYRYDYDADESVDLSNDPNSSYLIDTDQKDKVLDAYEEIVDKWKEVMTLRQ